MSEECIHGLELARCDSCSPKPVAVIDVPAKAPAASRARAVSRPQSAPRSTARSTARRTAAPSNALRTPTDDVGTQRIYHVTHVDNLAGILPSGHIYADASAAWGERPAQDISSADNREARRVTSVAGTEGPSVASYVPFSLSPKANIWEGIVVGSGDPRLGAGVSGLLASDFVILVSTVKQVIDLGALAEDSERATIVVTDGDAAHSLTRFAATREPAERMLRRIRADQDSDTILQAELLVEDAFPVELLTLIGVANDRSRDVVKGILQDAQYRTKVAVYPPWFRPAEEDVPPGE